MIAGLIVGLIAGVVEVATSGPAVSRTITDFIDEIDPADEPTAEFVCGMAWVGAC